VLEAYRNIFRTLVYRKTLGLRRFATENFVFDDQIGHVYVVGDPSLMPNMPFPKGTEVYARVVHCPIPISNVHQMSTVGHESGNCPGHPD
jgi:hypothetical protein